MNLSFYDRNELMKYIHACMKIIICTLFINNAKSSVILIQLNMLRNDDYIVIAHTFCTSPDTRISYRRYLLILGYFFAV